MGKKKVRPEKPAADEPKAPEREPKAQKSYSFAPNQSHHKGDAEGLLKVQLAPAKEAAVVDLIQQNYHLTRMVGQASHRVTSKKLTDFYMSLARVGFKHSHIESAMNNTVQYGGDLLDALDWLCLNLPNDQLPAGLSVAMRAEDRRKRRLHFDETEAGQAAQKAVPDVRHHQVPEEQRTTTPASRPQQPQPQGQRRQEPTPKKSKEDSMKDWILRYAENDSSEESEEEAIEDLHDPNERYLVLTAKLLDAKDRAADAKSQGDKSAQKEATANIRAYLQEMSQLEDHRSFNQAIKFVDDEPEEEEKTKKSKKKKAPQVESPTDNAMEGFAMFEEQAATAAPEKPKPKSAKSEAPIDVRSFEYTRKQWTGKSPKQFLIDWIRKHEPKSPPPAYSKVPAPRNLWKSTCKVQRKEAGLLSVKPEILTETKIESEHLASTLALYHLCKGQRVYQLLPPPYRDVWLEWQDSEDKVKQEAKSEENKPRDMFVAKLIKSLKLENTDTKKNKQCSVKTSKEAEQIEHIEDDNGPGESWEDLASDEDWDASPPASPSPVRSPPADTKNSARSQRTTTFDARRARETFARRQASAPYQQLLTKRQELPVYAHRERLLEAIRRNSVLVVAGETGSGKSTQIPQFVLEEFLTTECPVGSVVVTEPRRISAQSLAVRVSSELGEERPGVRGAFCGYQVRFEAARSDTTRLLYCTTGVLLRRLQLDPELNDVSHVIVDEVHERSVDSDFLLIILKRMLERRRNLKVVLMSATVDSDKFSAYFQHCPVYHIPGRTFPVQVYHLEDVVEKTNYKLEEDSAYCLRPDQLLQEESTTVEVSGARGKSANVNLSWTKEDISKVDFSGLDVDMYSKHTRNVVTRMNPKRINLELILDLLKFLDRDPSFRQVDGAVLIFMPGLAHIQELFELMQSDRHFNNPKRYRLVALHSVLSSQDQNAAFDVPPPGVRKVVIATNIAETGITIPDVVFVIDSGKVKENRYSESSQMSSLVEVYVSQASARQRQGRAGRVQEGYCFRLYTQTRFETFQPYAIPEILRVPLEELCLHIMKCELGNPTSFLSLAIDAPAPPAVARAMRILREVGACQPTEPKLTPLGQHLAALPVNVRVGKMLIFGAIFGCLEPVAVIAASMSDKSPLASPIGQREQANAAHRSLAAANSDHLTLYNAYIQWKGAQEKGYQAEIELCNRLYLKRNTLIDIDNLAKDLIRLIQSIGFGSAATSKQVTQAVLNKAPPQLSSRQVPVVKAVLTAGLYSHVATVTFSPKVDAAATQEKMICYARTPQGPATCHPSSVNRFLNVHGWMVYQEKVRHTQVYIRDTSLISPYPILLFGGDIEVQHREQIVTVDDWIKFKAFARTAVIFKELRMLIDNLLERKLANPSMNVKDEPVVEVLLSLLTSERSTA